MTIIAKTDNGFILEATNDEVANLAGYYWPGAARDKGIVPKIGSTVNIAAMYRHLSDLGGAKTEIRHMAAKLHAAADLIETLPEPITEACAAPDAEASND